MSLVVAIRVLPSGGTALDLHCGHVAPLPYGQGAALDSDVPCEVCSLVREREGDPRIVARERETSCTR